MTILSIAKFLFFFFLCGVFYAYFGYSMILYALLKFKNLFFKNNASQNNILDDNTLPHVTFLVAAFNEARWIEEKIENSLALDYPKDKIHFYFVTDGSDDDTPNLVKKAQNIYGTSRDTREGERGYHIELFHQPERKGKIAAVERIMPFVKSPIVIFTDANTDINPQAVRNIVRHYQDPKVGGVAGEKRVQMSDVASGAGEGFYWKYESTLKKWDSELYSVVGAAGELFSIRTDLHRPVETDTLIEDFVTTLRIAQDGYRVMYEPDAYAVEAHSANVEEELKRKVRISAGGLQAVWRLRALLNPFRYGILSFQYISHRVLRWTVAPIGLPIIFLTNIYLAKHLGGFYTYIMVCQIIFYAAALLGWLFDRYQMKVKLFYIPYYFCMMNFSVYLGFKRLMKGQQSVVWDKAKRADE